MERDWRDFKALHGNIEGARAAFEPACETLLRKMFPDQPVQMVRANPGDEGIDILIGEIGIEPIKVFQCKFFLEQIGNTQKGEIRKSFKTAVESKEYEMSEWTLCLPKRLDIPEHKWWAGWKNRSQQKYGIPIHLKNGDELIDLMKEYGIYERVFQIDRELKTGSILEKTTSIESLLKQSITQATPLTNHAQQVEDWLTALGYTFEPEIIHEDSHIGWFARKGFERVFILIVCDVIELPYVTLLRQYVEQYGCSEGWIVTTLRISPQVRQEIQKEGTQHLCCYTFDEFLDKDADFSAYVEWLESQIKDIRIDQQYIPLAFQKREFNPHTRTYEPYTYHEEYGWLEGYLDQWLDDSTKRHISILGEFGMGKTWSTLHYAWRQLQYYQEAKQGRRKRSRLPLYIPLREYPIERIETLFSKFITRYQIPLPNYAAFEQLNKFGKLLLIFDGFDEVSNVVNPQEMSRNFWELARAAVPDHSKVILTCRNEFFLNAKDARVLLNAELRESTAHLTGESPQFEILELVPFTEEQIRQALVRHTSPEVIERIVYNPNLMDLARRPVLIELIVEALPDIEAEKPVDMARIYLYAISRKLQRDIKEGRTTASLFDKVYFLCELSCVMLYHPMSLNYTLIRELITVLFSKKLTDEQSIESWTHDMLVQSVLIRDEEGNYTPAHRSFLDFFVAYKAASELGFLISDFVELLIPRFSDFLETQRGKSDGVGNDAISAVFAKFAQFAYSSQKEKSSDIAPLLSVIMKPDRTLAVTPLPTLWLIHPWIHNAVLDLLYLMMLPFHEKVVQFDDLKKFLEESKGKSKREVMYAVSNFVMLFLKYQSDFFKGKDLSHLHLPGLLCWLPEGKQADFTGTLFQGSDFTDANFSRAILTHANLRDTILNNVSFRIDDLFVPLLHPQQHLLAVESREYLLLVNIETNSLVKKVQAGQIGRSKLSPDQQHIVTVSGKTLTFIELETFSVVSAHVIKTSGDEKIDSFVFGDSPDVVICGGDDLTIYVWNIRENTLIRKFELEHEQWSDFNELSISPNKRYVLASTPETVQIWDLLSERVVFISTYPGDEFPDHAVFHPQDDDLVLCKTRTDIIEIMNMSDCSPVRSLQAEAEYKHVYFNNAGSLLAVMYSEKVVLYDYYSGQIISECHVQDVEHFLYQFSEDSLHAALRRSYWNRLEFSTAYNDVVFTRNGKFIHTIAETGYLLTYEIQTGTLHNVFAYMEHVEGANFTGSTGLTRRLAQQLKGNGAIINPEAYE